MKKILLAVAMSAILFAVTSTPKIFVGTDHETIAVELNTPMTVSAPACDLFFMYVINSAKIIEKPSSPTISEPTPINAPIAIPVNAP